MVGFCHTRAYKKTTERKYALHGAYPQVGEFGPDDEADLEVGPARVRYRPRELLY